MATPGKTARSARPVGEPVLLTSRADDERSRLFSCAVAVLYAHWQATGQSAVPAPIRRDAAE